MTEAAIQDREAAPRRTQAERRAAMQTRLLEATIDCLVERGAAGATTAEIERRAGVSRGARLHHYPTKGGLFVAAVEHLYRRLREAFESEIKAHMQAEQPGDDRFAAAFRLLWSSFVDARHGAVLELFLMARTDPSLRESLRRVAERHHEDMQRRLGAYFPASEAQRARVGAPELMESIHAAMQGLALRRLVFGEDVTEARVLARLEDMSRAWLRERLQPQATHADDEQGVE